MGWRSIGGYDVPGKQELPAPVPQLAPCAHGVAPRGVNRLCSEGVHDAHADPDESMPDSPSHAFTPAALERIRRLLDLHWSAAAEVCAVSGVRRAGDPAAPRSTADYAAAIAGIVAAGGTKAEVAAFLRAEEETLLGTVRSASRDLATVGRGAWLAARGRGEERGAAGADPDD